MINLAIVDDHQMVIDGLCQMLRSYNNIAVGNTYNNGNALLAGLQQQQPDVLLLDIQLTDFSGEDLVPVIVKKYPAIRILAVTSVDKTSRVRQLIRLGCLGYLLKNTPATTLAEAIQTVYRREAFITPVLKEQILMHTLQLKSEMPALSILLTRREKEILQLVAREYSSQDIANELFISLNTVINHRKNLFQKMDVKNLAGLIRKGMHMGLID